MKIVVLGAAAGGGFPQWNSNAPGCRRARAGDPAAHPRTQAGLAVSVDGDSWFLLNASPDLRQQIASSSCLHPREGLRSSPIAGVVLTCAEVDAIAGLLCLRERHQFAIYATARVHAVLDSNPIFEVLARDVVRRRTIALDEAVPLLTPSGRRTGLTLNLIPVPGKAPLYLESGNGRVPIVTDESTVAAVVGDGHSQLFFIPGCAEMSTGLATRLRGAELVFFDGTLWQDDEMIRAGLGQKTGQRMGHMSFSGEGGTLEAFAALGVKRKILLHINNSNPLLLDDSPERAQAEAAGWEIAHDSMELTL